MTTTSLMASAISTPSSLASFTSRRLSLATFSSNSVPHNPKVQFLKWIPYSGLTPFSSWNGLKQLCISKAHYSFQIGRSRKYKGKGVYASLFGVGAPEALVIGVVALLVFGPKGLAEVARNLGKTLREFQPTIRELQEVSKEFKTTLEREIGLDDIKGSGQDTINSSTTSKTVSPSSNTSSKDSRQEVDPNGSPLPNIDSSGEDDMEKLLRIAEAEKQAERDLEFRTASQDNSSSSDRAYSTEEYLKITEEQLKAAAQQQNETSTPVQNSFNGQSQSQDGPNPSQELSKITEQQQQTEMPFTQQSSSIGQSQSQESPEQAASVIPSSQKPESET